MVISWIIIIVQIFLIIFISIKAIKNWERKNLIIIAILILWILYILLNAAINPTLYGSKY